MIENSNLSIEPNTKISLQRYCKNIDVWGFKQKY